MVKNGGAREALASTRSILFDKTGTITLGEPTVREIHAAPDRDSLVCRVPARRSVGYNRTRLALQHPLQSRRVLARVHGVGSLHEHHVTCHPWFVAEPPMIVQVPHHSDAVMQAL